MIALICLLAPGAIMLLVRERVLNNHESAYKSILAYILDVLILNGVMILILYVIFDNYGQLFFKLNHYLNFACKYFVLAIVLALFEPFAEKFLKKGYYKMLPAVRDWQKDRNIVWDVSVLILVVGTIFMIVVLIFQHNYYSRPTQADLSQVQIADSNSYKYYIDSISDTSTQGDYILIKGWAVHIGEDLKHFDIQLVLYQDSLEDALVFKLAMKTRTDVTTYFDDGYNYDSSGFSANVKSSLIGDNVYNIALLYNDTKTDDGARIILTGKTFTCEEK